MSARQSEQVDSDSVLQERVVWSTKAHSVISSTGMADEQTRTPMDHRNQGRDTWVGLRDPRYRKDFSPCIRAQGQFLIVGELISAPFASAAGPFFMRSPIIPQCIVSLGKEMTRPRLLFYSESLSQRPQFSRSLWNSFRI
jgi:hypothetical protein